VKRFEKRGFGAEIGVRAGAIALAMAISVAAPGEIALAGAPDAAAPVAGPRIAGAPVIPVAAGPSIAPALDDAQIAELLRRQSIPFDYLDWLMPEVGPAAGGFQYGAASQSPSVRHDKPEAGVIWPNNYTELIGTKAAAELPGWGIRALIIYADARNASGNSAMDSAVNSAANSPAYYRIQDQAQGAACVDDTARMALYLADRFALTGERGAFERLRGTLAFVAYLTPLNGNSYNNVWLDSPRYFGPDEFQRQNRHYMTPFDYLARSAYPADMRALQSKRNADAASMVRDDRGQPAKAPPYVDHAPYSIVMNDLIGPNGADIAPQFRAPIYEWRDGRLNAVGESAPMRLGFSASQSRPGFSSTRALWAFAHARRVLAQGAGSGSGAGGAAKNAAPPADAAFADFLDGYARLLLAPQLARPAEAMAPKEAAALLIALADLVEGNRARPQAPVGDDAALRRQIGRLADALVAHQRRDAGPLQGLFASAVQTNAGQATAGQTATARDADWRAWGEAEIDALAQAWNLGPPRRPEWLAAARLAADGFYARAWDYFGAGRARITALDHGAPQRAYQIAYDQTPIALGLFELARAVEPDSPADAARYRAAGLRVAAWFVGNNEAGASLFDAAFPGRLRGGVERGRLLSSAGGESLAEGYRALVAAQQALTARTASQSGPMEAPAR